MHRCNASMTHNNSRDNSNKNKIQFDDILKICKQSGYVHNTNETNSIHIHVWSSYICTFKLIIKLSSIQYILITIKTYKKLKIEYIVL